MSRQKTSKEEFVDKLLDGKFPSFQNDCGETYFVVNNIRSTSTHFITGSEFDFDIEPCVNGICTDLSETENDQLLNLFKENGFITDIFGYPNIEPYKKHGCYQLTENLCPGCLTTIEGVGRKHHIIPLGIKGPDIDMNIFRICTACHRVLHDTTGFRADSLYTSLRALQHYLFNWQFYEYLESKGLDKYIPQFTGLDDEIIKITKFKDDERWNKKLKRDFLYRYLINRSCYLDQWRWVSLDWNYDIVAKKLVPR